jgi:hypothetical protein
MCGMKFAQPIVSRMGSAAFQLDNLAPVTGGSRGFFVGGVAGAFS